MEDANGIGDNPARLCQRKHETGGSEFEEWKDTHVQERTRIAEFLYN